jgi:hypothetical protein
MHIHGSRMPPDVGLYAAAAAEKAAAAARAAEVRKKLLRGAAKLEGEANTRRVSMIDQETEEDSGQRRGRKQPSAPAKKQTAGEESGEPISMWA